MLFLPRTLFALSLPVLEQHWWVPSICPSQSLSINIHKLQLTTSLPRLVIEKLSSPPLKNTLGAAFTNKLPSHRLSLGYHHRILVCPEEDTRTCCSMHSEKYVSRGPCYPKALTLEKGHMLDKKGKLFHSSLECQSNPCQGRDLF